MRRRVAAVDCGTNSIRLLIADVDPGQATLTDVDRRMEIVRLGQGVDTTGRLAPEALDRTLKALGGYAELIADRGHVTVVDGPAFGDGGAGAFRFNFATPQPVLTEMVEHMAAALNSGFSASA